MTRPAQLANPAPPQTRPAASPDQRLALIVETMREMSLHTDPETMVRSYGQRLQSIFPLDRRVSVSRRDLRPPHYRITRSDIWPQAINPWKQKDRLPVYDRGLIAELIHANEPRVIGDLRVDADDPAAEHFAGMGSLMALPLFDGGEALNMVLALRRKPHAFTGEMLPELVWMSNLFGKATHGLVMAEQVREAYQAVERELEDVARIQRLLLPAELPDIPGMKLAAHYQTSRRAGGDYYDFFPLDAGRWGILIADVSGHGTPAAVFMAIARTIAHTYPRPLSSPAGLLCFLNRHLCSFGATGNFMTAFFAVYDPEARTLVYSSAGHNPPRVQHCSIGRVSVLEAAQALPLGIDCSVQFPEASAHLDRGDQIVFYTDGITEAHNPRHEQFGVQRLDQILQNCSLNANSLIQSVLQAVETFSEGRPADDDRTLVVAKLV
jgi:sigma-B regulation protein RsbU (phosphoserine phosphatase)